MSRDYGHPLRVWDNGGKTADRYTIIAPRSGAAAQLYKLAGGIWECVACGDTPFHPQGFCQWSTAQPGSHLGRRVHWDDVPEPVKRVARERYPQYF